MRGYQVGSAAPDLNVKILLAQPGVLSIVPVSVPLAITINGQPSAAGDAAKGGEGTVAIAIAAAVCCSALAAAAAAALWLLRRARKEGLVLPPGSERDSREALGTTAAV